MEEESFNEFVRLLEKMEQNTDGIAKLVTWGLIAEVAKIAQVKKPIKGNFVAPKNKVQ